MALASISLCSPIVLIWKLVDGALTWSYGVVRIYGALVANRFAAYQDDKDIQIETNDIAIDESRTHVN